MSRYIDAEWLIEEVDGNLTDSIAEHKALEKIAEAPSIDIVRCQDCKYWVYHFNGCSRNPCTEPWYATDFCNYGQKGDENVETD